MTYANEIASRYATPSVTSGAATIHHLPQVRHSLQPAFRQPYSSTTDLHSPVLTTFGDQVDVRKRGALRIMRMAGMHQGRELDTPAVVRLWHEDQCRELTAGQARALANQLLAAADMVDGQNRQVS